ncbi:hypothetical protein BG005_010606 [Podila minutissima]|nr:hypothetical protein BG005_010606 [Podila minutissima]
MFTKALLFAALAAPAVLAYEPVTCSPVNATRSIITSIDSADSFCTFLTGYGVRPVAPNEGCGGVYCQGPVKNNGLPMPKGYILSSNYARNDTNQYVQVTGCIDSSVWAQDPTDEGGQMDSNGWPYSCQGYKKFVSLIEPATNTFCIRCCMASDNSDCNTSISTHGCWNVVPGLYAMPDGSACKPPVGAPSNTTAVPTVISSSGVATAVTTGHGPVVTSSTGSGSGNGSGSGSNTGSGAKSTVAPTSAGSRLGESIQVLGSAAALVLIVAANL